MRRFLTLAVDHVKALETVWIVALDTPSERFCFFTFLPQTMMKQSVGNSLPHAGGEGACSSHEDSDDLARALHSIKYTGSDGADADEQSSNNDTKSVSFTEEPQNGACIFAAHCGRQSCDCNTKLLARQGGERSY